MARTKTMPINIKKVPKDITENKVSFVVFTRVFGAVLNLFRLSRNRLCAVRAHKTFPASERGVYILNTHSLIHEGEVEHMAYCPKCGNEVDETMTFCPRCGASLKAEAPVQAPPPVAQRSEKGEKGEKQEKREKQEPEKGEKHEKGEHGFIGWLVGGIVIILIGFLALLRFSGYLTSGLEGGLLLLIVGVVIIIVAIYFASIARRRTPPPPS